MSPAVRRELALALLVATAAALPYVGTLRFEPTYDDHEHVVHHPLLAEADAWRALTPTSYFERAFPDQSRPLLVASLLVDRSLFGARWGLYHLQNILLHALVAALAFLLVARLGFGLVPAALGALLFAVHPAATEAVASVSNREELLSAAAGLAALLLARSGLRDDPRWLAAAGLALGLALLAKEVALAIPLLFFALALSPAWLGPAKVEPRRWAILAACAVAGAIPFAIVQIRLGFPALSVGSGGAPLGLSVLASMGADPSRWIDVPTVLAFAALRALLGWPLSAEQPTAWLRDPLSLAVGWTALALVVVVLVLAARSPSRARSAGGAAFAWFLVASAPTSAGPWLLNPIADRYLYLPCLGVLAIVGAVLASRRDAGPLVLALALALAAARTGERTEVWRDDVALFEDASHAAPDSARVWLNLGAAYLERHRADHACYALERAVALAPDRVAP
ncbi:MAG: phospholipid carrier-dependent glycosyltransferase, partial [Sandaracinaceae bacterium]